MSFPALFLLCSVSLSAAGPYWSSLVPASMGLPLGPNDIQRTFPAPNGQTVHVLVKGPVGGGVFTMRPINSGELPDDYFPAAVAAAVQAGVHKLVIPKGVYNFNPPIKGPVGPPHWLITYVNDLEIDGQGSVLNFSEPRGGIAIQPAQRIRLRNFTIDWPNLQIASLGTIVQGSNGQKNLQIDSQYNVDATTQVQGVNVWDTVNNTWAFRTTETYPSSPPIYIGNRTFSSSAFSVFDVGTRVLVRHYIDSGWAVAVATSSDIDLENITVLASPGYGFFVIGPGNRGFRLAYSSVKRASGHLISAVEDCVHVVNFQGDVMIENNELAYQGDDTMNITATFEPVLASSGTQVTLSANVPPTAGDFVAFFDPQMNFLGAAQIQSVSAPDAQGNDPVTLDQAVPGVNTASLSVNLTEAVPARYLVQNNNIHDHRARGTLVRAAYGLVNHNTYKNDTLGAILAGAELGEGPGANNLIISNNTVSGSGELAALFGAIRVVSTPDDTNVSTVPIDQGIVISNNTVNDSPGPAFLIASAANVSLFGNSISNTNQYSSVESQNFGSASSKASTVVYGASQVNLCGTQISGTTTGPLGIDPQSTSGVNVDGAGCSSSPILGNIDGLSTDDFGNVTVTGWACAAQWPNPVLVQVYAGGPAGSGGTFLTSGMASQAGSPAIAQACQSSGAHYFIIPIPRGLQSQFAGKSLYLYGLSPVGAGDTAIGNSGNLTLPDPAGTMTGKVEGLFTSDGQNYVTGWACAYGAPDSIAVHYYGGGPAGSGQLVDGYMANLPSEPAVGAACGDATNSPHRFMIPLAEAIQDGLIGQGIYLHGISPSGQPNLLIQGSGSFSATASATVVPQVNAGGILHAASFAPTVAPGALASLFGSNLGIDTALTSEAASAVPLPASLNGVSVTVNGRTAPLVFAGPGQINFQVPYGTSIGTVTVFVTVNGQVSNAGSMTVAATAPGIFAYGANQAVAQNQGYTLNDSGHPAQAGSVVTIYATGLGALDNPIATGAAAPDDPLSHAKVQPTVTIGGVNADVLFAGMTPGFVGLAQINVTVPALASGRYPVVIDQGEQTSNNPAVSVTQ